MFKDVQHFDNHGKFHKPGGNDRCPTCGNHQLNPMPDGHRQCPACRGIFDAEGKPPKETVEKGK